MRKSIYCLLGLLTLLSLVSPRAYSQEWVKGAQLRKVTYSSPDRSVTGSFEQMRDGYWRESNNNGQHDFMETKRDEWSVYLKDDSRSITIQIDLYRKMIVIQPFQRDRRDIYNITGKEGREDRDDRMRREERERKEREERERKEREERERRERDSQKGVAIVYADYSFKGESMIIMTDVNWIGNQWNDRISSIHVNRGYQLQLFADAYYKGASIIIEGDWQAPASWNDKVSSMKVIRKNFR